MQVGRTLPRALAVSAALFAALVISAFGKSDARGRDAFEKRCSGCHTLDKTKVGPALRGVFGRKAGSDPAFPYSDALKTSPIRWDEQALDRWLADTDSVVPGNDMPFRLGDKDDRGRIIAYLKEVAGK